MVTMAKSVVSSLTFRCVFCVAVYACAMALVFSFARAYVQRILSASSVTIEKLEEQTDALENDRFDVLTSSISPHCEVVVYDAVGTCLYASTSDIATNVPFDDLFVVASSDHERVYYEVLERPDYTDRNAAYEIVLCEFNEEEGTSKVLASCVCDKNLHILGGDLFSNAKSLTPEEFALIRGDYGKNMQIEKYEYKTARGEARTLVLASLKMSEKNYRLLLSESERVWPFAFAIAVALTAMAILAMFCIIRESMHPLEKAIRVRRHKGGGPLSENELPLELRPTYGSFVELMDVLDAARKETQVLIADISHDLKTPLAVIGGYARAFEDGHVSEAKRQTYLHAIYEKSQVANDLLDSLLTISRLDHPSLEPDLVTCDLCEQVRLSAIAADAEVSQAKDSLEVDIADVPLWVDLDRAIFARVLGNLISNACRHNEPGTSILVQCRQSEGCAVVSVLDDGAGFSPQLRDSAFDPFVTENVARESGKGSGLGLTIAKKGVLLHGGCIFLSDDPPAPYATEVVIKLPLSATKAACDHS